MNATHIHLLLNHVSIMAAIFSVIVFAYGFLRKLSPVINVGLAGFVVAALTAIPVFLTGEPAEESVENIPGILESVIEQHEEAAELALWIIEIAGVLAFSGLVMRESKFFKSPSFYAIMMVASLAAASAISYTGYLGGQIRHTELGVNAAQQTANPEGGSTEDGDDD